MMLRKGLFWGWIVSFSICVLCWLILIAISIFYADPKTITTNPEDPDIEKGYVRYMEQAQYETYRLVVGKIHLTGIYSTLITFVLYGLHSYVTNKKDKNPKDEQNQ